MNQTNELHFYQDGCCVVKLMQGGTLIEPELVDIFGPFFDRQAAQTWIELPENSIEEESELEYQIQFLAHPELKFTKD